MSFGFGFALPAYPLRGGTGNNPFNQDGATLDLSFVGTAGDLSGADTYTLNTDFITPEYQVAAQYAVWENGVGLAQKTFSQIVTFTRASTATYFNSAGTLTSAAINAPRFDYDPATLAAQGLLIEEARTNSIRNNTMVGAVAGTPGTLPTNWSVSGTGTLTREIVGTGTVNGVDYIDIRFSGTTSSTSISVRFDTSTGIAATNGQTWAASLWFAVVGGSLTNIVARGVNANLFDSGVVNISSPTFSGVSLSGDSTFLRAQGALTISAVNTAYIQPQVFLSFSSGVAIDITLRIGLPQLEQGAFATSVIPTTTTALTRSADVASVNTLSPWFNQTEGTIYAQFVPSASATQQTPVDFDDGTSANRISPRIGNQFVNTAGVVQFNTFFGATSNAVNKYALALKTNDSAFYSTSLSTDSSITLPVVNRMSIGNSGAGTGTWLNGWVQRITYYPRRLSNADLQTITT